MLLLAIPETYRNSHVVAPGFDAAVGLHGGRARIAWCSMVEIGTVAAGQVAFSASGPQSYVGTARHGARFHFPLSGGGDRLTPDCRFDPGPSRPDLGSAASVSVKVKPAVGPVTYAYFDGKNVVPIAPPLAERK